MTFDVYKDFGKFWPVHVASLTKFLIECRKHFDGDMDLFIVMCVVGDRTFSEMRANKDIHFEDWQSSMENEIIPKDINTLSISEYSGIPRETVRRKVNSLIQKGWIARDENGFLQATQKAKIDLESLTLCSLRYIEKMFVLINTFNQS